MKNSLKRWADKFVKSGAAALFVFAMAIVVINSGDIQRINGDNPATQVNWNAGGG